MMTFKEILKDRFNPEKVISGLSIVIGLYLIYDNCYLYWAYTYSSILFLIMLPISTLVCRFIIGVLILISGILFPKNIQTSSTWYRLAGIFIALYTINEKFLDIAVYNASYTSFTEIPFIIIFGLFLFFYFNQKKYKTRLKARVTNFHLLILVIIIFICIDLYYTYLQLL